MAKPTRLTDDTVTSPHLRPHTADLNRLLAGEHHDPHSILGAHEYDDHTVIRAYRPHATEVAAVVGGERHVFTHLEAGVFAVTLPFTGLIDYRLEVSYVHGGDQPHIHHTADAYRFLPTLGEMDLHLFSEGRHERLWEALGAHPRSANIDPPTGGVEVDVDITSGGLQLRVVWPGQGSTDDVVPNRVTTTIEKGADGKYRIAPRFDMG